MNNYKFNIEVPINILNNIIGPNCKNVSHIEDITKTEIEVQAEETLIAASNIEIAKKVAKLIKHFVDIITDDKHFQLSQEDINHYWNAINNHESSVAITNTQSKTLSEDEKESMFRDKIGTTSSGKNIYPKTIGQKKYFNALKKADVSFCVGPAGTGKTFLAIAYAIELLSKDKVKKIIISRPAIEAGENLGFLPGTLKEKIDPYLTPLYDALYIMLGKSKADNLIEKGIIEISPLAYMRGRTFSDAFVILDEAQNSTAMQMKMILTRLGYGSKMVITGDIQQIDIKPRSSSGVIDAWDKLSTIKEISFIRLNSIDINRHPVVKQIVEAYEHSIKNK